MKQKSSVLLLALLYNQFCSWSLVSYAKPESAKSEPPLMEPVLCQFSNMLCIILEFIEGINSFCRKREMLGYSARWVLKSISRSVSLTGSLWIMSYYSQRSNFGFWQIKRYWRPPALGFLPDEAETSPKGEVCSGREPVWRLCWFSSNWKPQPRSFQQHPKHPFEGNFVKRRVLGQWTGTRKQWDIF